MFLAHLVIDPGVTLTALVVGIAVGFVLAFILQRRREDKP